MNQLAKPTPLLQQFLLEENQCAKIQSSFSFSLDLSRAKNTGDIATAFKTAS
jgi:hypothetical protein